MDKVMIAMSGGVDSAVAAYLTTKNAFTAGVTMYLARDGSPHAQTANKDIADARAICEKLQIPHLTADLSAEFSREVVDRFVKSYLAGETPNPGVDCNRYIKFGALFDFARENGYEQIATGHYARIERDAAGKYLLRRAKDSTKDQSYMLYSLSQRVLSATRFPLGDLSKQEVRDIAAERGFAVAHKSDSQDICFVPNGDYASVIEEMIGTKFPRGKFLALDGKVLGEHQGMIRYTIGQGKGLGISLGKKMFVIAKSATDHTVTLGDEKDLYTTRLTASSINLIPFDKMSSKMKLTAKARYRQAPAEVIVEQTGDDELTVEFTEPQRAIAAGQSLVLYDGDYVIGGGKIN